MTFNRRHFGVAGAAAVLAAGFVPAALAQSADETAVKAAVAAYYKAYLDFDGKVLNMLISDKLSFGHSDGRIEDKKKVVDDIVAKKNNYKKFTLEAETVEVLGSNATVRHRVKIETELPDGKPGGAYVHILQVWQKEGSDWRLFARQAVPVKT